MACCPPRTKHSEFTSLRIELEINVLWCRRDRENFHFFRINLSISCFLELWDLYISLPIVQFNYGVSISWFFSLLTAFLPQITLAELFFLSPDSSLGFFASRVSYVLLNRGIRSINNEGVLISPLARWFAFDLNRVDTHFFRDVKEKKPPKQDKIYIFRLYKQKYCDNIPHISTVFTFTLLFRYT